MAVQTKSIRLHAPLRSVHLAGAQASAGAKRFFVEPGAAPERQTNTRSAQVRIPAGESQPGAQSAPQANRPAPTANPQANRSQPPAAPRSAAAAAEPQVSSNNLEPIFRSVALAITDYLNAQKIKLKELEKPAIELALSVAEHIVGRSVDAEELNLQPLMEAGLKQLAGSKQLQVKLNPADLANVGSSSELDLSRFGKHIELLADPTLPIGGCVIESESKQIASTLQQRFDNARQLVLEGLQS